MKVVPPNFGYVEEGIFRCGLPEPQHYAFLTSLGVKTCVLLTEAQDNSFVRWMQESGITILCPLEPNNRNSVNSYNLNYNENMYDASRRSGKVNVQSAPYNSSAQEYSSMQIPVRNDNNNYNNDKSIEVRQHLTSNGKISDVQESNEVFDNSRPEIINAHTLQNKTIPVDLLKNDPLYNNNNSIIGSAASTREGADVMSFPTNDEINMRLPNSHAAQFVKDNFVNRKDKMNTRSFHDFNHQFLNTTTAAAAAAAIASSSTSPPPSTFASPNSLSAVTNEQLPLSTVRMMLMTGGNNNTDGVNYNGNTSNISPFMSSHYAISNINNNNNNSSSNNNNNNNNYINRFPVYSNVNGASANVTGCDEYNHNSNITLSNNNQRRFGPLTYAVSNNNNNNVNMFCDRQMEYEVSPQSQMTLSEPVVVSILRVLIDPIHYPLLITGAKGRYRTGIVCGCLRKLQRWNLVSILSEYRRYAGDKSRPDNEEFIELFDKDLVSLELENGRKPTILYSV